MAARKPQHNFVSYSHHDEKIVGLLVQLIRATLAPYQRDAVFLDSQHLEAGKPWRTQILKSIAASEQVFVFWCRHSAESVEVAKEWRYALRKGKRVVPVRLDQTPFQARLGAVHGPDLQEFKLLHDAATLKAAPEASLHRGYVGLTGGPEQKPQIPQALVVAVRALTLELGHDGLPEPFIRMAWYSPDVQAAARSFLGADHVAQESPERPKLFE